MAEPPIPPIEESTQGKPQSKPEVVNETIAPKQLPTTPIQQSVIENPQAAQPEESKTTNSEPQTSKTMEAHHHGHVHEKKKWKEYLFQFLMLFLAVFCGFLAEYQLEHLIEKQKGRQYIASFLQDLEIDNIQLDQLIPVFIEKDKLLDTLLLKIRGINPSIGANGIYKYYRQPFTYPDFIYTDRTIQQLKNSGGMRIITNKAASDSIIGYDAAVRLSSISITEGVKDLRVPIMLLTFKLFDLKCCPELGTPVSSPQIDVAGQGILLTYDNKVITEYFNAVQEIKRQFALYLKDLQTLKRINNRVTDYLRREYHLK